MTNLFYRAFEEKYRGSREHIKSRLQIYLPFIQPLLQFYPAGQAIDVGCGRGEWLEVMAEHGFDAIGIDIDEEMLRDCRERSLRVQTTDAINYLQSVPNSTICVVSGFHLVEHLQFEVLQKLVQEAMRVLVPGGLLMLETPNPENICVGTNSFYMDPTHQRPIPPELLSFLPEFYGYRRHKVVRLQENTKLRSNESPKLMQVLSGVSPDYAVIAQTQGTPLIMEALAPAFDIEVGLTLDRLAERFQTNIDKQFRLIASQVEKLEASVQAAEARAEQAEIISSRYASELLTIYSSRSWRITAPLRWPVHQVRLIIQHGFKVRAKAFVRKLLIKLIPFVMNKPALRSRAIWLAYRLGIAERLKPLVRTTLKQERVVSFQQLRSVRIMIALSNLPVKNSNGPVTYLEVFDDVN